MSAHTKGMLFAERIPATFNPKMDGFQLVGSTPDGIDLMTVALCTVNEADEANAERLAACWNACDGIPVEVLESMQGVMKATVPYHELKAQRDELLSFAKLVLRGLESGYVKASQLVGVDESATSLEMKSLEQIGRAAIEKAEGGAS